MKLLTPVAIGAALLIGGVAWYVQRTSSQKLPAPAGETKHVIVTSTPRAGAPTAPPVALPGRVKSIPDNPLTPAAFPVVSNPALEPDPEESIAQGKVTRMFRDFRTRMGENPVGTNAEIMRAMAGDNPKQLQLSAPEGMSVNENGELVDRWGTPYFFHQLSKDLLEIRSAGPDKKMWTSDDIVTR